METREQRQLEIESNPKLVLAVPIKLNNPHHLILQAKNILSSKDAKSYKYPGMLDASIEDGIDIRVFPNNVQRALRFMDTFIKLCESRGHNVRFRDRATYVDVKGEEIKIACREKMKTVETPGIPWATRSFIATDVLSFKSEGYHSGEWKDGTLKLEEQLSRILAYLETSVEGLFAIWAENEKRDAERKALEQIEQQKKERKERELSDFKKLFARSVRWQQSKLIRDYLNEFEKKITGEASEEDKKWLEWASKKADWFDPFVESDDSLLDGIDRDTVLAKEILPQKVQTPFFGFL
jgi:hypothetical protein